MYICVFMCGLCPQGRNTLKPELQVVVHQQRSNTSSSKSSIRGEWWCTPLILVLRRQGQVDLCIWGQVSLQSEFQTPRATQRNCVLKIKKKKKIGRKYNLLGFIMLKNENILVFLQLQQERTTIVLMCTTGRVLERAMSEWGCGKMTLGTVWARFDPPLLSAHSLQGPGSCLLCGSSGPTV